MNQAESKIIVLSLMSMLSMSPVQATKLAAQPLPHRSDFQPMNGQAIVPPISRYNRNPTVISSPNNEDNSVSSAQSPNSQQQIAKKQEIEKAKVAKQKQLQALATNNKAVQLGKLGKFDEAIAAHEEAVQLDPSNKQFCINLSAAYCAYGQRQLAKNDFAGASHFFRKALVAASDNALAGRLLVDSLKKMGLNPYSADDRLNLADGLMTQGDIGAAGIEYQAAEQLEESARTLVKMGDYAYRLGQPDIAASWYSQATLKDPDYAAAYRQLGFIAIAKQDFGQAASLLRKAIILDSKDKVAGSTLVDLWHKQVAANPQIAENHLGLASSLQLTGDLATAELEYRKVAALDPHHPALSAAQASLKKAYQHAEAQRHAVAADTLWNQNLRAEALAQMSQAVRIEPQNAQYQFSLGECLEAIGDLQGAHQAYLTCILIDPENNKEAAVRLKALQDSATNAKQNAVTTDQNSVSQTTNNNGGQSGTNPGMNSIDISSTEKIESNKNIIPETILSLEAAHNYDRATTLLKELVSNNLENPEMHHHLAVDLMSNGEIGEAISEFRIASALAPSQKAFAADLAQALNINKQALSQNKETDLSKSKSPLNTTTGTSR